MNNTNKESTSNTTKEWEDYQLLEETKKLRTGKSTLYVPKKDRYEDLESSAVIFTCFGIIGDVLVLLTALDIINIPFFSGLSSQITMAFVFTAFLIIGIHSWFKAKTLKPQISTEEDTTSQINTWMKEHITKEILSSVEDSSSPEEVNILSKLSYMHDLVSGQFPEADSDYLDLLIDNFYNDLYADQSGQVH
ncbi:MAG: hypothetical protein K2N51_20435 [Lachnospiraceae bacterium]|nr:hypothetical protein [Lachnospiraceae bacterium]